MQNWINWFEIPASNFSRAVKFYEDIFSIGLEPVEMFGSQMGLFPSDGRNVSGAVVKSEQHQVSGQGVLAYLNGGDNLDIVLGRVEAAGGKILVPKTQISPDMGYFAIFADTEGNTLALHSMQ